MTQADDALLKLISSVEQNAASLLHIHETTKIEKSTISETKAMIEIVFNDGSRIEVTGETFNS